MSASAKDYYQNNATAMKPVRDAMGEFLKTFGALHHAATKPGVLSTRDKELIAVGIALSIRCDNCIYNHVKAAVAAGATREQISEAASVAVMMGGGPVYTYLPHVFEALAALEATGS